MRNWCPHTEKLNNELFAGNYIQQVITEKTSNDWNTALRSAFGVLGEESTHPMYALNRLVHDLRACQLLMGQGRGTGSVDGQYCALRSFQRRWGGWNDSRR